MYAHIIHMTCVCVCVSHSVISNSLRPLGLSPTRLLRPWNSPGKNTGIGCHSSGDLPDPGIEPRSPAMWAEALTSEPQGKPFHEKGWLRGQNWGTRRLTPRPWSLIKKNPTFGQLDFRNVMDSFSPSLPPILDRNSYNCYAMPVQPWILEVLGADNQSL